MPCQYNKIWQNDHDNRIVKPVRKLEMDIWISPADQQGESCWY